MLGSISSQLTFTNMGNAKTRSSTSPAHTSVPSAPDTPNSLQHRLRACMHLIALLATVPLLLLHALCQLFSRRDDVACVASPLKDGKQRTVLVTGAKMSKALHAARSLWRAGHRVILVETDKYWCSGSRLSRAVTAFDTVTDPRVDGKAYLADLQRVFEAHGCDTFLPVSSPFSAHHDAMFLRSLEKPVSSAIKGCFESKACLRIKAEAPSMNRNLHFSPSMCDILDDKHAFSSFCSEHLGLQELMLPSHLLSSDAQVLQLNKTLLDQNDSVKFVIKNLAYDPLHRLDLFCLPRENEAEVVAYLDKIRADGNGVSKDEPWQAQLFVEQAREFACYAVVRNSQLQLFTACLSSASQLRYVHLGGQAPKDVARNPARTALVDKQTAACREWLETFCAAARATGEDLNGQLCLDFMCTVAGGQVKAYPLECNPRVHSMCCVFTSADQRRYGQVLVGNAASGVESVTTPSSNVDLVVQPSPSARAEEQFIGWWANEFYSWRNNPLVNLLEVVYAILYFFLTMGGTAGPSPAFRYVDKTADPNAAWYTKNFCFRDADFDPNDPLPFLGRNLLQPLVLMWGVLCRGNEWKKYDYCIGKVVEKNGD